MSIGPRQLDPSALEEAIRIAEVYIDIEIYEEYYCGVSSDRARVENMTEVVTEATRAYLIEADL